MATMSTSKLMVAVMITLVAAEINTEKTENLKDDPPSMICVYPISGQYGTLSRYLFYALMVFACFSQRWSWPRIAALAYIMNYSATAAVHAFLLLVTSRTNTIDLDVFGTWAECRDPRYWSNSRVFTSPQRQCLSTSLRLLGLFRLHWCLPQCICLWGQEQSCRSSVLLKLHESRLRAIDNPPATVGIDELQLLVCML